MSEGQTGGIVMTPEQLQEMMKTMATAITTSIVAELNKPTPEQAAKAEKERLLMERRRNEMIQIAKDEEEMRARMIANCSHTKENGKPATGGQRFSDGFVRMFCLRCGSVRQEYKENVTDLAGGIGEVTDGFPAQTDAIQ